MFASLIILSYLGSYHFVPKIQEILFQIYLFLYWVIVMSSKTFPQIGEAHTLVNFISYVGGIVGTLNTFSVTCFLFYFALTTGPGCAVPLKASRFLDAGTELFFWPSWISLL